MVKQYLLLFLFLFNLGIYYAQTVNIQLSFTDGIGSYQVLYFGLDSTATDGIDPHLGESPCPVYPPTDMTEVRFNLQPFIGQPIHTYKDYRHAASFPYTGVKQHRLIWQLHSQSSGLTMTYNLPDSIYIVMTSNNNTPLYSVNLYGSGSFIFPYPEDMFSARMYVHYSQSSIIDSSFLSFTPAQLNFGSVLGGQVYTKVLNVKNLGNNSSVTIDSFGVNNNNYNVIPPSGFPVNLLPGQSINFNIQITANPFSDSTNIYFYHNGPGQISSIPLLYYVNNSNVTEADIIGKLRVTSGGYERWLYFGLDSTATDGIDLHLGENEIPPPCPPTCFDARMILPVNNYNLIHSFSDYRFAFQPFVGQKEYRLYQQPADNENVVIYWDLPPGITGYIRDIPFSDINVPITDTGSFVITQPYDYTRLRVLIDYDLEGITPVELIAFAATTSNNTVLLNWTTGAEKNNLGFEVERASSSDTRLFTGTSPLQEWEKIGYVKGNGTTTIENNYNFTDNDITEIKYFYRLKQIDFDGSFKYSNVIEVITSYIPTEYFLSDNYPNPFNPVTTIEFSLPEDVENVKLTIYDALGKKIAELVNGKLDAGKYSYQWDASKLASGLYIYQLQTSKFTSTKKMLLMK